MEVLWNTHVTDPAFVASRANYNLSAMIYKSPSPSPKPTDMGICISGQFDEDGHIIRLAERIIFDLAPQLPLLRVSIHSSKLPDALPLDKAVLTLSIRQIGHDLTDIIKEQRQLDRLGFIPDFRTQLRGN